MSRRHIFAASCLAALACLWAGCTEDSDSRGGPVYCESTSDCSDGYECVGAQSSGEKICVELGSPVTDCGGGECADAGGVDANAPDTGGADATEDDVIEQGPHGRLAAPQTVWFGPTSVGASAREVIELRNDGEAELAITSVSFREKTPGDGSEWDHLSELNTVGPGWDLVPVALAPGERHLIEVEFSPENTVPDAAEIVVESNDSDNARHVVEVRTPATGAALLAPDRVSFGRVPPRPTDPNWQGESRLRELRNVGVEPLDLYDIYVAGSDRFWVSFPQPTAEEIAEGRNPDPSNDLDTWPTTIPAGERIPIRLWFAPDDNLPESGELVIDSNDADARTTVVDLAGNSGAACLSVYPAGQIDFGSSSVGHMSQKTVTLENCSRSADLEISDISLTDDAGGAFGIDASTLPGNLPGGAATIGPGEAANVVVTFDPADTTSYAGELTVESDDPANGQVVVPVRGTGANNSCPSAVAEAWLQGSTHTQTTINTVPLNTIMFDGSSSTDPDGSVDRYEWTVLSRPPGSTQRLLPSSDVEDPRLFLDLAGTYEIELKVYDDQGVASCGSPAIITIVATPSEEVHVQLVWDTPSDPDQTDSFGSDLDLHYLHPDGEWNSTPWDIFWRNPQANWGDQTTDVDDPSLDIDDTDGAGPENLNHSGLESLQYRAGVFYYSDSTLGASYATLRVYIHGTLAMEVENKYMPRTGSFWDAVTIDWPSATVTNISRMYDGFPTSP